MSTDAAPDPAALGASMAHTMPPVTGAPTPPPPAPAASAETGASAPQPAAPAPAAASASPEVDAKGRPFDGARFLAKKDKRGLWLPKSPGRFGGAKRPPSSPSQPPQADLFQSAASSPSSSPSASAPASSPGSGAASASYIPPEEELPPPPSSTQSTPGASKADNPGPSAGADDVAAVACDLLSEGVGLVTGAPEEAEPTAKEAARLREVLGAYLRSKGVETSGLWAVLLAFGAWLLRTAKKPKTRAWVKTKMTGRGDVIDIEPRQPEPAAPSPAPAAPPPPAPAPVAMPPPSYVVNFPVRR